MTNGAFSTPIPGTISILNNSDQTAIHGFTLTPSSTNIVVSTSDCSKSVPAYGTCSFEVNYIAPPLLSRDAATYLVVRSTTTLTVNAGASNADSLTVNTISMPYGYLFDPTVDDTNAHGIDATINVYNFVTLQKNGFNFVYAATDKGVFKTSDGGVTWVAVNGCYNGTLANNVVNTLCVIGALLFVGTNDNGVFATSDGGATWTPMGLPTTLINDLAYIGSVLYAATANGVFSFDTSNAAAGWTLVGLKTYVVTALCTINNVIYAAFLGDAVYYYNTSINDWSVVGTGGTSPQEAQLLSLVGDYLYAATPSGVYRISTNSLTTTPWESFGTGLQNISVNAFSFVNGNLLAGTSNGVYKIDPSASAITSWTPDNTGFRNRTPVVNALCLTTNVSSPLLLAGLALGGIYTATPVALPNTETWSFVSNTLTNKSVRASLNNNGVAYAATYGDGVFTSTDNGANWTPLTNNGLTNLNLNTLASFNGSLVVSVDNGATTPTTSMVFALNLSTPTSWQPMSTGLGTLAGGQDCTNKLSNCALTAKTLYLDPNTNALTAGIYDKIPAEPGGGFYTFNTTSSSWVNIAGLIGTGRTNAIAANATNIFASTYYDSSTKNLNKGVYVNSDPAVANAWTQLNPTSTILNKNITTALVNPSDNYLYTASYPGTSVDTGASVLFRISTNTTGSIWNDITPPTLSSSPANALCLYNNQTYAGFGNSGGVYAYNSASNIWTAIPVVSDIGSISVWALQATNNYLQAGTDGHGVLRATMEGKGN